MNKRGIETAYLIGILILIVSAAILYYVIKVMPYTKIVSREACRLSVVARSNKLLKGIGTVTPNELVPLNCKTEEIKIKTANPIEIEKEIANAMYDCWWQLGEGKKKFWTDSLWKQLGIPKLGRIKSSCVICSVIKFDERIKNKALTLDMVSYLQQAKVPDKNMTYLEYFTETENAKLPAGLEVEEKLTTKDDYVIIFMGIDGGEWYETLKTDLKALLGITAGTFFIAGPRATGTLFRGLVKNIKTVGWIMLAVTVAQFITHEYYRRTIVAGRCDGEKRGCMQIILMPYDAKNITKYCDNIESIP